MKTKLEEQINQLHFEITEYTSLKERNIISQNELNIVIGAINEELYHLYKHSITL